MTIKSFANSIGLRADVQWTDHNPNMPDAHDMSHYRVTLKRRGRRQLTVAFSMGSALCREPEAVEVLDCLISDTTCVDGNSFEDFAAELGYDPDSRKAERIYQACQRTSAKLHQFLGDEFETACQAERL